MDNSLFLDVVDELDINDIMSGNESGFTVDTDQKAEWVVKKIRQEHDTMQRIIDTCRSEIERYTSVIEDERERFERNSGNLIEMLNAYFSIVDKRSTKTQESYRLPSAQLIRKHKTPKVERNDDALIDWMKDNAPDYVMIRKSLSADWGEFKKQLTISGDEFVTSDGQIVEGVKLIPQPDEFRIVYDDKTKI